MKWLKLFLCSVIIVSVMAVPCFATNQVTYSHYIRPGDYVFDSVIEFYGPFELDFTFTARNNVTYTAMIYDPLTDGVNFIYTDANNPFGSAKRAAVYDTRNDVWNNENYRYITVVDGFYIDDPIEYQWWMMYLTPVDEGYDYGLLHNMTYLFSMVGMWLVEVTSDLMPMFWDSGSLTFLGTLAVAGLALSVSFLIIGLIQRFLKFKS